MKDETKYCPECQVGVFKREGGTYYTWIGNELVIVPDFPCWVCDVCGHRDWDQSAVINLSMILSPGAGNGPFDRIAAAAGTKNGDKEKNSRKSKPHRSAV